VKKFSRSARNWIAVNAVQQLTSKISVENTHNSTLKKINRSVAFAARFLLHTIFACAGEAFISRHHYGTSRRDGAVQALSRDTSTAVR
jgi:hypothetical protein